MKLSNFKKSINKTTFGPELTFEVTMDIEALNESIMWYPDILDEKEIAQILGMELIEQLKNNNIIKGL